MGGIYFPECRAVLQLVFEDFVGIGSTQKPLVVPVMPQQASVAYNGYNQADTWTLTFLAKDMPITPDLIKAGAAEVYIYNRRGIGEPATTSTKGSDEDLFLQGGSIDPSIVGLIDEAEMEYETDGQSVTISGRDYTSLFLDKEYLEETSTSRKGVKMGKPKRIPVGKPLDTTLKAMIAEVPGTQDYAGQQIIGLRVVSSKSMPIVGSGDARTSKRGISLKQGASYWDAMQTLAIRHGFLLFVDKVDVVLTDQQSWGDERGSGIKKLAWGRNLTSLHMSRKIGKERVPRIRINAYDPAIPGPVAAIFPDKGVNASIGLGTERDEIRDFFADSVSSRERLKQIAEQTYRVLSRSELEINITTKELEDQESSNLLDVRAGDAWAIGFDPFDAQEINALPDTGSRIGFLVDRGYSPKVATVIANNFEIVQSLRAPLRVREATIDWDSEEGVEVSAELHQFVNVSEVEP